MLSKVEEIIGVGKGKRKAVVTNEGHLPPMLGLGHDRIILIAAIVFVLLARIYPTGPPMPYLPIVEGSAHLYYGNESYQLSFFLTCIDDTNCYALFL